MRKCVFSNVVVSSHLLVLSDDVSLWFTDLHRQSYAVNRNLGTMIPNAFDNVGECSVRTSNSIANTSPYA